MSNDLLFVLGIVVGILSLPSFVGAFTEGRPPRTAIILLTVATGLVVYAMQQHPSGYTFETIPDVFSRVIRDIFL